MLIQCFLLLFSIGDKTVHAIGAPSWSTPSGSTWTTTLNTSVSTACDQLTLLNVIAGSGGGSITYSLVSQNPAGGFAIGHDMGSGLDTLTCNLATVIATAASSFVVVLRGTQSADSQQTDITVTVNVLRPNNNDPQFHGTPYNVEVTIDNSSSSRLNESNGYTVMTVSVTDADGDAVIVSLQATGTPFIVSGNDIKVANASGLLSLSNPYNLVILATDDGIPPRTATETITVTLTVTQNNNDNDDNSSACLLSDGLLIFMLVLASFTFV